jgi:hypothetical protein
MRFSELLLIVLYLAPTVLALSEALRFEGDRWDTARQSQGVWVVVILLLPIVGPLLYYLIARPRLLIRR